MFDTPKREQTPRSKSTRSHKNNCREDSVLTNLDLIHSVNMDNQHPNNPGFNPQTCTYISLPTHRSPALFLNLPTKLIALITTQLTPYLLLLL